MFSGHSAFLVTMMCFENLMPPPSSEIAGPPALLSLMTKQAAPPPPPLDMEFPALHLSPVSNSWCLLFEFELFKIVAMDFCAHFVSLCAKAKGKWKCLPWHNMLPVIFQRTLVTITWFVQLLYILYFCISCKNIKKYLKIINFKIIF